MQPFAFMQTILSTCASFSWGLWFFLKLIKKDFLTMSAAQGAVKQSDRMAMGVWDWPSSGSGANSSGCMRGVKKVIFCSSDILRCTETRLHSDPFPCAGLKNVPFSLKRTAIVWRTSVCWQVHYTFLRDYERWHSNPPPHCCLLTSPSFIFALALSGRLFLNRPADKVFSQAF